MTVAALIAALQTYPPETPVDVDDWQEGTCAPTPAGVSVWTRPDGTCAVLITAEE